MTFSIAYQVVHAQACSRYLLYDEIQVTKIPHSIYPYFENNRTPTLANLRRGADTEEPQRRRPGCGPSCWEEMQPTSTSNQRILSLLKIDGRRLQCINWRMFRRKTKLYIERYMQESTNTENTHKTNISSTIEVARLLQCTHVPMKN